MSKPWKTAFLLLLVGVGILLVLTLRNRASLSPQSSVMPTAAKQPSNPVALTAFFDNDPSFTAPGCWEAVPRGLQTFAKVPFRIEGLIQLWGEGPFVEQWHPCFWFYSTARPD